MDWGIFGKHPHSIHNALEPAGGLLLVTIRLPSFPRRETPCLNAWVSYRVRGQQLRLGHNHTHIECLSPTRLAMDRLPNEIWQMILDRAMIRDAPLSRQSRTRPNRVRVLTRNDPEGEEPLQANSSLAPTSTSLLHNLHKSQKPHFLDWQLINGTCQLFRKLGKRSFFANKTFAMEPAISEKLQQCKLKQLSVENQQMAVHYIRSVIFIETCLFSPRSILLLPRRVAIFPRLRWLDHLFAYAADSPSSPDEVLYSISTRKALVSPLHDLLCGIGVPTDRLELGSMRNKYVSWEELEATLRSDIYPMLRFVAEAKARQKKSGEWLRFGEEPPPSIHFNQTRRGRGFAENRTTGANHPSVCFGQLAGKD
ncbi:hypothetical protein CIHG_09059 [Coccidioides immitis H538.4]|uniref:Uncharacterized protein n=1 Tax=Coccidioides immitis H538.4 TaxID=396776 RepID=A0A0J8S270_COCIT|nr:hypothetical protein CIHG_09059 [Coccidioides immitis H538.4]